MAVHARGRLAAPLVMILLVVAGCDGISTPPTGVTQTQATLRAQTRCLAQSTTNPCT